MAKNWAICVGINRYYFHRILHCAVNYATEMRKFFKEEAKFDNVYLFTDNSKPIPDMKNNFPSQPTYGNFYSWLGYKFKDIKLEKEKGKNYKPPLSFSDNLWFFFSGHGWQYRGEAYLLFADSSGDPEGFERTAIPLREIIKYLRRSQAGNIIILLDACRDSSSKGSSLELSKEQGIITISSCQRNQLSYEIKGLNHGAFTFALLESLRIQGEGNCATVERLCNRLRTRVPEITREHHNKIQIPYEALEPASKCNLLLLPDYILPNDSDLTTLKNDALKAEIEQDLESAKIIWTRLLRFAQEEALESLYRIRDKVKEKSSSPIITEEIIPNQNIATTKSVVEGVKESKSEPKTQFKPEPKSEPKSEPKTQFKPKHKEPISPKRTCSMIIIAIGGTGAKCAEAIIHLAAVGLFSEQPIEVIFIDPDKTNGNIERAINTLTYYRRCYQLKKDYEKIRDIFPSDSDEFTWMKTPLENFGLWSPISTTTNKTLKDLFDYKNIQKDAPALANLFDVLYTKDQQNIGLDVGFRSQSSIGSAIMAQLDLDSFSTQPWKEIINNLISSIYSGQKPSVFLCGAIFGGTGASGLSTITRLIINQLEREGVKQWINMGCLLMLPYFGFTTPPGEDPQGIYARSEQFLLNTEAALRYYVNQAQEIFDTVFLLGNQNFSPVHFSVGKNSQRNAPHFLELYGALAARHFYFNDDALRGKVVLISRRTMDRLTWDDIPDSLQVRPAIVKSIRFAYTWLSEIAPEIDEIVKNQDDRQSLPSWLRKFFTTNRWPWFNQDGIIRLRTSQEQEALKIINNWCQDYLTWWYDLHQNQEEQIELLNTRAFGNPRSKLKREQLNELVYGSHLDSRSKAQDTIQNLKRQLQKSQQDPPAELAIIELARTLYVLSKQ